jgi:hypothetical protein
MSSQWSHLQTLPLELIREILLSLEFHDLFRLRRTCGLFRSLICEADPLGIWLRLCRRDLLDGPLPPGKCSFMWLYASFKRHEHSVATYGLDSRINQCLTWAIQNNCNRLVAHYLELYPGKDSLRGKSHYEQDNSLLTRHLSYAAQLGHATIVRQIVEAGINPILAVWSAIAGGHHHIIDLLIELGLPRDKSLGNTILMAAAENGQHQMIAYARSLGADEPGRALFLSAQNGHDGVVEILIPLAQPHDLHLALRETYRGYCHRRYRPCYQQIAERLLQAGADWFDPTNTVGADLTELQVQEIAKRYIKTPGQWGLNLGLQEAYNNGWPRIAKYLLSQGAQWFDSET